MAESTSTSIFDNAARKEARLGSGIADQIDARAYNAIMSGTLFYGFLVNTLMVAYLGEAVCTALAGVSGWIILLGYLICSFAGIFIAAKSDKPLVSFLGYNLLVVPLGILLCLILPGYPIEIITKALLLTGVVTATMVLLGLVAPQVFLGLGRTLFIALIVGLIAEVVATFGFGYRGTLFDWLFVIIFSGYIGYDIAKSQAYPKTIDNAVDCALDIYLDVINLFLRILALLSKKN